MEGIDLTFQPTDSVQVEVQREVGFADKFKLYVHYNGQTILRISKIPNGLVEIVSPHVCMDCGHSDLEHDEICRHRHCDCMAFAERARF